MQYSWTPAELFDDPTSSHPLFTGVDDGSVPVEVSVTDDVGATSAGATIEVTNVAPTVTISAPASTVQGQPISVGGTFADPGASDTHAAVIAWGDGTTSNVSAAAGAVPATSHTYSTAGPYTITLTVTDDDSGAGTASTQVTVAAGPITVAVSDAQANEGTRLGSAGTLTFTVRLSRADPNATHSFLYGTLNGSAIALRDYIPGIGVLTFKKGETVKTITVKTLVDRIVEANETMTVQLLLLGSGLSPSAAQDPVGVGTIVDDD